MLASTCMYSLFYAWLATVTLNEVQCSRTKPRPTLFWRRVQASVTWHLRRQLPRNRSTSYSSRRSISNSIGPSADQVVSQSIIGLLEIRMTYARRQQTAASVPPVPEWKRWALRYQWHLLVRERCRRYLMTALPIQHTPLTTDIENILKVYLSMVLTAADHVIWVSRFGSFSVSFRPVPKENLVWWMRYLMTDRWKPTQQCRHANKLIIQNDTISQEHGQKMNVLVLSSHLFRVNCLAS